MTRVLTLGFLFLTALLLFAQGDAAKPSGVPAYHQRPPAKGTLLPAILPGDALWGENFQLPFQSHAYLLASRIPEVIYQQPCYCYCDRMGHQSLHSCFESTHAAGCGACLKELYYSYEQTKKHKTAAQIRRGIIRGDWKQVDLNHAASMN